MKRKKNELKNNIKTKIYMYKTQLAVLLMLIAITAKSQITKHEYGATDFKLPEVKIIGIIHEFAHCEFASDGFYTMFIHYEEDRPLTTGTLFGPIRYRKEEVSANFSMDDKLFMGFCDAVVEGFKDGRYLTMKIPHGNWEPEEIEIGYFDYEEEPRKVFFKTDRISMPGITEKEFKAIVNYRK
jgi:hypothetical protein